MIAARRRLLATCAALLLLALPAGAVEWRVSFEAVAHDEARPYASRAVETVAVVHEIGPSVLSVLGLGFNAFDADVTPGGYQGRTNPSVLVYFDGEQGEAEIVAAAFGHVFGQESVLLWRETDAGDSLVVSVALPAVTPNLADHFFRHAASVNRGLAGGFTVRESRLMFINLRDRDGRPLSGLSDDIFAAALRLAADNFGGLASVTTGRVMAKLVDQLEYAGLVSSAMPRLERLRTRRLNLQKER